MNDLKHIIANTKAKVRKEYFPDLEESIIDKPSITIVDNCLYTGGLFDAKDPLFLNEILTTEGYDLTRINNCVYFLLSKRGRKIQKAKYRDNVYKKVKKYCKKEKSTIKNYFLYYLIINSIMNLKI